MHNQEAQIMEDMYTILQKLCKAKKITITDMCRESGVPRSSVGNLASGSTQLLSAKNVQKLANYFNVSADYLLGNEEKDPPEKSDRPSEDDIKIALFGGDSEVTDEMWEEAKQFAKFIKERETKKRE